MINWDGISQEEANDNIKSIFETYKQKNNIIGVSPFGIMYKIEDNHLMVYKNSVEQFKYQLPNKMNKKFIDTINDHFFIIYINTLTCLYDEIKDFTNVKDAIQKCLYNQQIYIPDFFEKAFSIFTNYKTSSGQFGVFSKDIISNEYMVEFDVIYQEKNGVYTLISQHVPDLAWVE